MALIGFAHQFLKIIQIINQQSHFPSLLVLELIRPLVGHQLDSVFPSCEPASLVGVVELLPDDDADTGREHEEQEEDDEPKEGYCCYFRGESVDRREKETRLRHVYGKIVPAQQRSTDLDLVLLCNSHEEGGYLGFAVVLVTQVVQTDVQTYGIVEVEAQEGQRLVHRRDVLALQLRARGREGAIYVLSLEASLKIFFEPQRKDNELRLQGQLGFDSRGRNGETIPPCSSFLGNHQLSNRNNPFLLIL